MLPVGLAVEEAVDLLLAVALVERIPLERAGLLEREDDPPLDAGAVAPDLVGDPRGDQAVVDVALAG